MYKLYFILYNNSNIIDNVLFNVKLQEDTNNNCIIFRFFYDTFLEILSSPMYDINNQYPNFSFKEFLTYGYNSSLCTKSYDLFKNNGCNDKNLYNISVIKYFEQLEQGKITDTTILNSNNDYKLYNELRQTTTNLYGGALNDKYNFLLLKYNCKK